MPTKVDFMPEEELVKIYKSAKARKMVLVMRLIEEIHAYRAAIAEFPDVLPTEEKDNVIRKMREDMIKLQHDFIYMRTVLFKVADICPSCKGESNMTSTDSLCETCFNMGAVPKTSEAFAKAVDEVDLQKPPETKEEESKAAE